MKNLNKILVTVLLISFVFPSLLWSGTTGKIAGKLIDKDTGELIIGANIILEGKDLSGGEEKNLFMMEGIILRDPRNNEPSTKIALSSVKNISVERG